MPALPTTVKYCEILTIFLNHTSLFFYFILGTSKISVGIFHTFHLLIRYFLFCLVDEFFNITTNYLFDIFRARVIFLFIVMLLIVFYFQYFI